MIIETPVLELDESRRWLASEPRAFERLIAAHDDGVHLFVPAPALLDLLVSGSIGLSETQRAVIADIKANYSEFHGQAISAYYTVLVVPSISPTHVRRSNQTKQVVAEVFSRGDAARPARAVVEDHLDGELLALYCDVLRKDLGYAPTYRLEPVHGGGASIQREFERQAIGGTAHVTCVTDSDILYAGGPSGDNARVLGQIAVGADNRLAELLVLPCREIENTVPVAIMSDVYAANPAVQARIGFLDRLVAALPTSPIADNGLRYVDLKLGLKRSDVRRLPQEGQQFWKDVAAVMVPGEDLDDEEPDELWSGVSRTLARQLVEHVGNNRQRLDRLRAQLKQSPMFGELVVIVRTLCSAGVAAARTRAR